MRRLRRHSGFTLLELILVMVIMSTVLALASPSIRGWGRGSALRDAVDQFVAVTRLGRTQAVATGQWYRLCVEPTGLYYLTVRDGDLFVPVAEGPAKPVQLPEQIRIELTKPPIMVPNVEVVADEPNCIDFYPTGRTQVARVRIFDERTVYEIECAAPGEVFRIVNAESAW